MRSAALSVLLFAVAAGQSFAQEAGAPASPAQETAQSAPFQDLAGQAKSRMMADPAEALDLAQQADDLALACGQDCLLDHATALWLQGEALKRLNRSDESVKVLEQAIGIAREHGADTKLYGDLLMARAGAARVSGDYASALQDYQDAQSTFAALGENRSLSLALQQVGSIYTDAHNYERALEFYRRAGEAFAGDPSVNLARLNNMAHAYRELAQYDKAAEGFRDALKIAVDMDSPMLQARILTNLAAVQLAQGDLIGAEDTVNRALSLSRGGSAQEWEPFLYGVLAEVEFARGNVAEAGDLITRTFEGVDLDRTPMPFREFHDAASKIYNNLGQTRLALRHLKAFKRLDDEARNVSAAANTALMGAQFDFTSQELRLARLRTETLEKEVALNKARARQRNTIFVALGAIGLIALAGGGVHYASMRRSRNDIRKANVKLGETNVALERALKAKSEFLATTSHEIRTPLNGMLGMTQLLMRRKDIDADVRERVELVHGSGLTMKAIVDDILDMAKIETGAITLEVEECDIADTLNDVCGVWSDSARSKGVALNADIEAVKSRVVTDERRVRQIVFNLLSNAVKFTEHGAVSLKAELRGEGAEGELVVLVSDTGCGIPTDQLDQIFEPFHQIDGGKTRKHGGTGLGLSICRKLARALNGDVTVDSVPGEGSTFTLRVPVTISHRTAGAEADATDAGCILILDANPLRQNVIEAMLDAEGRTLIVHEDPLDMVQAVQRKRPGVVLAYTEMLGDDLGQVMDALMQLREAAGEAHIAIVLEEGSLIEPPMLRLAGADAVVTGDFDPVAIVAALGLDETTDKNGEISGSAASAA
ncbi:MAG: ATP-binding protein [Hyphomonadaceae bacterium]